MSDRKAWIEIISEQDATGELARLYERTRDRVGEQVDNILMIHSLNPRSLSDHWELYRTTMKRSSDVSHAEREMIAVVVSAINACHY
jgi:alkylhydroperoxidase family enzyme